jgi:hypothetical protein
LIKEGYLTNWIVRDVKKHKENPEKRDLGHSLGNEDKPEEKKFVRREYSYYLWRTSLGGDSNHALERYAREARHRPLTNVNSLDLRPPKMFKGECVDITFTVEKPI